MPRGLMPRVIIVAMVALAVGVACESKPQGPTPEQIKAREAEQAAAAQRTKDRAWQRMKDCTEQTDRAAKKSGWVEGRSIGNNLVIMGWESHYNPKHDRCFVLASFINKDPKRVADLPLTYQELFDPFENRTLAMCTDNFVPKANLFCSIQEGDGAKFDCRACAQYIKDRMEN